MKLRIGAMADFCGVTPRALRLYQEAGILRPELVDPDTGYRCYSVGQSVKLDMVCQLQAAGFTLGEIARIEAEKDVGGLRRAAELKAAELASREEALRLERRMCEEIAASCGEYLERGMCGVHVLERMPARRAVVLEPPTMGDLGGDGPYTENERWEFFQQYAKREIAREGYPPALYRRLGCYVPEEAAGPGMNLLVSRPLVFVDESFGDSWERSVELPAKTCLTVCYDDCHSEDGAGLDEGRLAGFFRFMGESGLVPDGPFTMENIFRFIRLFNQNSHAYFRYCMPVRRA